MITPNKRELAKIGLWLMDGDVGQSSKALASFYLTSGFGGDCASTLPTPIDPSDFQRCVRFLEDCVDKNKRYDLIRAIGETTKNWRRVRDEWFVLMDIYEDEKRQFNKDSFGSAPRLYAFMKKIEL